MHTNSYSCIQLWVYTQLTCLSYIKAVCNQLSACANYFKVQHSNIAIATGCRLSRFVSCSMEMYSWQLALYIHAVTHYICTTCSWLYHIASHYILVHATVVHAYYHHYSQLQGAHISHLVHGAHGTKVIRITPIMCTALLEVNTTTLNVMLQVVIRMTPPPMYRKCHFLSSIHPR